MVAARGAALAAALAQAAERANAELAEAIPRNPRHFGTIEGRRDSVSYIQGV